MVLLRQSVGLALRHARTEQSRTLRDVAREARVSLGYLSEVERVQNSNEEMEKITGYKLFPSYSFTRVYQKGEELTPHVDRPACEISVTCHIATVGSPWPVWMQAPGEEPTQYTLEPGDACVYKGCEIKHWRQPATETDINVQMMLHYVDQNGPCAGYKYDQRPGLALRK